jgi:hypothetical protein
MMGALLSRSRPIGKPMPGISARTSAQSLLCAAVSAVFALPPSVHSQQPGPLVATLKTSDVRIELVAGRAAPRLIRLQGPHASPWQNL